MTFNKYIPILFLLSVCLWIQGLSAQQSKQDKVNALFKAWDTDTTPGATIGIIKDGMLVFKNSYGMASLENNVPNTTHHLFNIASNSKQFTSYAMLTLASEGKLSLDEDIRTYIPELPDFGKVIKVKTLAQHTHGMRGIAYLLGMAGWHIEDVVTRKQVLQLICQQNTLNFIPETDFLYNNTGYMLLAEIIERTSGMSFYEYLDQLIFKPLGMEQTTVFDDNERILKNLALPYYYDGTMYKRGIRNAKDIVGNTGIRTSIEDLSKWVINYSRPTIGNTQLLETLSTHGTLKDGVEIPYGLGQVVTTYKGYKAIQHGGADAGYRSQILRFPEEDLSILVLTNDGSINADKKAYDIAAIFLDIHNIEETTPSTTDKSLHTVSKNILQRYEGKFEMQPGFVLEFHQKDKNLYITATGQGTLPLETINNTQFRIRRIDAVITFLTNEQGEVDALLFDHNGNENKALKIVYKINPNQLQTYAGRYYSDELKTSYELTVKNGQLIAQHARQETTTLTPIATHAFSGNTWFFGNIEFTIHKDHIQGFKASSDRALNVWFTKEE